MAAGPCSLTWTQSLKHTGKTQNVGVFRHSSVGGEFPEFATLPHTRKCLIFSCFGSLIQMLVLKIIFTAYFV